MSPTSGCTIELEEGAELRAIPTDLANHAIIRILDVDNVTIRGAGKIVGDLEGHISDVGYEVGGQAGMGVTVLGSTNVTVEGITVEKCWADGVYVAESPDTGARCSNITIRNVTAHDNRREGIAVFNADDVLVDSCTMTSSGMTAHAIGKPCGPSSGFDVEPNQIGEEVNRLTVTNCTATANYGRGFMVSGQGEDRFVTEFVITGCVANGNGLSDEPDIPLDGVNVAGTTSASVSDVTANNNGGRGFHIRAGGNVSLSAVEGSSNGLTGIEVKSAGTVTGDDITTIGNQRDGVRIELTDGVVFTDVNSMGNNQAAHIWADLAVVDSANVTVSGNVSHP